MLQLKSIKAVAIVLAVCCVMPCQAATQKPRAEERTVNGANHETTLAELDLLAQTARENPDTLIFLIARLGSEESSRRLNRRRLFAVRDFLRNERLIPRHRLIAAEGESLPGLGRVEVYLSGKLYMVFILPRNKFFAPEG